MKICSEKGGLDLKTLGRGTSKEFLKLVLVDTLHCIQLPHRVRIRIIEQKKKLSGQHQVLLFRQLSLWAGNGPRPPCVE